MFQKRRDAGGEFGVGRLFPEMTPRQSGPTSRLKVRFTNDRGRCDRSAAFANSVPPFLRQVFGPSPFQPDDRRPVMQDTSFNGHKPPFCQATCLTVLYTTS